MNFEQKLKNLGLLLLGVMLLAPASWAQYGQDRRDNRDNDVRRNNSNYGVDFGYQDGLRQGQSDRARRAAYNVRSRDWQRGDRGYNKSMGAKGQYKQGYRDGYARGYEEAYYGRNGRNDDWGRNRRNDYPNSGGYGNGGYDPNYLVRAAQQNGMTDGAYYAQQDRSRGNAYNPTGAKGYRDADHGYSSNLGSKADFQRIYREAFIRGYQQGYGNVGYRR